MKGPPIQNLKCLAIHLFTVVCSLQIGYSFQDKRCTISKCWKGYGFPSSIKKVVLFDYDWGLDNLII